MTSDETICCRRQQDDGEDRDGRWLNHGPQLVLQFVRKVRSGADRWGVRVNEDK